MLNNIYIGLSQLKFLGTINDFDDICKKYQNNIKSWYVTPPFGEIFKNRSHALLKMNQFTVNELLEQFTIINNYNQEIQLAFNSFILPQFPLEEINTIFNSYIEIFGMPNSIVSLDKLIPLFKLYNLPLTYSFNNYYNQTKLKNLKDCEQIVIGGTQYLRNLKFMDALKTKYNIKIELLLNNGCHFYCTKNCEFCLPFFNKRIKEIDYITLLAEQTLLPFELKFFPKKLIDSYKISSRPSSKNYFDIVLNSYVNQLDTNEIIKEIDLSKSQNWFYFSRLVYLLDYLKQYEPIDISAVIEKKIQLWENLIKDNKNIYDKYK